MHLVIHNLTWKTGTEYDVLPSLLQHGAICALSGLFIEYHRNEVVKGTLSQQSNIILTHSLVVLVTHPGKA